MSVSSETLNMAIAAILKYNTHNQRPYVETVELQIGLKNYDPARDKRFAGSIILPYPTKTNIKILVIGDQKHLDECNAKGFECIDAEGIKSFKKDKKLIKRWVNSYDVLLASDSLIRQIPRLMGPQLGKASKFPSPINHEVPINTKVDELKRTVKFQMKKVLCLGVAVGNVSLNQEELYQNISISINLLISLLKKGWQNIRSLHIKSTTSSAQRIY